MNIAVIGVGGVGGYFGGKLCAQAESSGDRVHFIARGAHLAAIRANGLLVKTAAAGEWTARPASATEDIEALPPPDIVLLCVKSFDLEVAAGRLARVTAPGTIILPLANGVDIYERVRRAVPRGLLLPACVYVGTHIERPGVVTQSGGACRILFGPDPRSPGPAPAALTALFTRARIAHEWFADPRPAVWTKFVFIAAFGLVTAAFDRTLGDVMGAPDLVARVRAVMAEIAALAKGAGVPLPESVVADGFARGNDFPPGAKTSFQRDVELKDKPDERDLFGGTIVRLGEKLGVPVPATRELAALIERRKPARA